MASRSSDCARDLKLSRKSVSKAIRAAESAFDYSQRVPPLPRIGPFQERLDTLLTDNDGRAWRDRLRMTRFHYLLQREGFELSYDTVRRYARPPPRARNATPTNVFMPPSSHRHKVVLFGRRLTVWNAAFDAGLVTFGEMGCEGSRAKLNELIDG